MIFPQDPLSFGLVEQKQKLSEYTGRPKTERRHRKLMLSALDKEVGNAKLSCGQTKPAKAKQGQMSVGDGRPRTIRQTVGESHLHGPSSYSRVDLIYLKSPTK